MAESTGMKYFLIIPLLALSACANVPKPVPPEILQGAIGKYRDCMIGTSAAYAARTRQTGYEIADAAQAACANEALSAREAGHDFMLTRVPSSASDRALFLAEKNYEEMIVGGRNIALKKVIEVRAIMQRPATVDFK